MKNLFPYIFIILICPGLYSCFKDDSKIGDIQLSTITITSKYDTLNVNFGEEVLIDFIEVRQEGKQLPLAYEWSYGKLLTSQGIPAPYPIKDSLHIISDRPELKYKFRELGTFCLRLKIDNTESIRFKYFILNVNSGMDEGIAILSRNQNENSRLSFLPTLSKQEMDEGKIPVFNTDVFGFINPDFKLEKAEDMFQHKNRLLILSSHKGCIYNMDSRTFQLSTATWFSKTYPSFSPLKFAGNSAQNYIYILSENKRAYVYECIEDELLLTQYFKDITVEDCLVASKPIFIDYTSSELFNPKTNGVNRSKNLFEKYDILNLAAIENQIYVICTYKNEPLRIYIASINTTLNRVQKLNDYNIATPPVIKYRSISASSKKYNYVFFASDNKLFRWSPNKKLPEEPLVEFSADYEITAMETDDNNDVIYIGLYDKTPSDKLKGSLYIYKTDDGSFVKKYEAIADKPIRILYKKRI